jgi:hypothetical protein
MRARTALIAAGISAVAAVGGGTAHAAVSSAVDSGGVIHGCVSNGAIHGTHILLVHDVVTRAPAAQPSWTAASRARQESRGGRATRAWQARTAPRDRLDYRG